MPFCSKCGKPLADGETCNCQNNTVNMTDPVAEATPVVAPVVENVSETPASETVTAPVVEPVTETVSEEAFSTPTAEPVVKPVSEPAAAPVVEPVSEPTVTPVSQTTAASQSLALAKPNKNNNKTVLGIIAGVVVIALIAIIVLLVSNLFGGSKDPVESLLKTVNAKETDVTVFIDKALPDFVSDKVDTIFTVLKKTDDYEDLMEEAAESLEDAYDDIEDEYGKKWSIEFDSKKTDLDKDELEEIAERYEALYDDYLEDIYDTLSDVDDDDIEDLADMYDISEKDAKKMITALTELAGSFEKIKVTDGYELKGKFIIKSKDDEDKSDKVTITVIKLNGEWTIDYLSLLDDMGMSIDTLMYYIEAGLY